MIISREYINDENNNINDIYKLIINTECHHDHVIIRDNNGVLRWKENKIIREFLDNCGGLNNVIPLLNNLGYDKNSEIYRKLYRDLGYSLFGYWEVFYWELNNEDFQEYIDKRNLLNRKLKLKKIKDEIQNSYSNTK